MGIGLREFPDQRRLFDALSAEIAELLRSAVRERGRAAIALSGGSTPVPLLDRLSALELPWSAVTVTLTDERWIDTTLEQSNEHLVRTHLLRDAARGAAFVGLKTEDADPADAVASCTRRIAALPSPLDAVVLGMGLDGHVASLFPGAVDPKLALDPHAPERCIAVRPPRDAVAAGSARMSLTLATLAGTRRLILLATGAAKRALLERVIGGAAPQSELPVGAVLHQKLVPPEIWWAP